MSDVIAKVVTEQGIEGMGRFYSSYRGYVTKNEDPMCMNRLKVCVPEVNGIILWALPKGQQGALNSGIKWLTPKIGDVVWVSFESGDLSKPIWEYYGWAKGEIPLELNDKNVLGFRTPNGTVVTIDDTDGHVDIYLKGDVTVYSEDSIDIASAKFIRINSGNNMGVPNIVELTEKLNQLVKEVEQFKSTYNAHTHPGVSSGPGSTAPTLNQSTAPISTFNQRDYEDTKFTH